ncbi:MAG: hypothetical protein QOH26_1288 [Actinomycetota bacterium]|jgi:transcriptional regulator with XRE-family HTH domain|nr:hypothetical protein [Actinomycetota bacterium]
MELKDRLAELRRLRGYSLRELRERIERATGERMAISYLSSLERLGGTPSVESLTRIAAGYGLTVQDLLEPVDFSGNQTDSRYPQSLLDFVDDRKLGPDWLETLSRIEYRGNRPDSEDEWNAIYSVLKLLSNRRTE